MGPTLSALENEDAATHFEESSYTSRFLPYQMNAKPRLILLLEDRIVKSLHI